MLVAGEGVRSFAVGPQPQIPVNAGISMEPRLFLKFENDLAGCFALILIFHRGGATPRRDLPPVRTRDPEIGG